MKKYLLDTNICISLIKNRYGLRRKIESIGEWNCAVSEITIAELFYGAAKSGKSKHYNERISLNFLMLFLYIQVTINASKSTSSRSGFFIAN